MLCLLRSSGAEPVDCLARPPESGFATQFGALLPFSGPLRPLTVIKAPFGAAAQIIEPTIEQSLAASTLR